MNFGLYAGVDVTQGPSAAVSPPALGEMTSERGGHFEEGQELDSFFAAGGGDEEVVESSVQEDDVVDVAAPEGSPQEKSEKPQSLEEPKTQESPPRGGEAKRSEGGDVALDRMDIADAVEAQISPSPVAVDPPAASSERGEEKLTEDAFVRGGDVAGDLNPPPRGEAPMSPHAVAGSSNLEGGGSFEPLPLASVVPPTPAGEPTEGLGSPEVTSAPLPPLLVAEGSDGAADRMESPPPREMSPGGALRKRSAIKRISPTEGGGEDLTPSKKRVRFDMDSSEVKEGGGEYFFQL